MAFGLWDTEIVKHRKEILCKIYTDGILNLSGLLCYRNWVMITTTTNFTGNFTTSMLNLKDRIGEDSIRDLAPNGFSSRLHF
jgi:hypothetical protein